MTDFSESLKITWVGPGSASLSGTVTRSGDGEGGVSTGLTALQANKHIGPIGIRKNGLQLLYIKSTTGCIIYNNDLSGGSPDGTPITVTAGIPVHYLANAGMTNPFSVDVADLYVTETDNAVGTVDIRWLADSTP